MKQNAFLMRVEREKQAAMLQTHRFTRQLMVDLTYIALNNRFGFGSDRLKEFAEALLEVYSEYADVWNSDTPDTEYSREKIDRRLRQIFGDDFHPWEVRYKNDL